MKFRIKDDDGKEFEVEELEETKDSEEEFEKKEKEEVKDDALTAEEIASLKQLAAVSSELIKLLEVEKEEHANDNEEKAEEVIDTDEHDYVKANDSKGSFGSIEKKEKKGVNDSNEYASQLEIENSWQNRFKGGNK